MTGRRVAAAALAAVAVVLTVTVLVRWHPLLVLDRTSDRHANALVRDHPLLLSLARGFTHLGDPVVVTAGAIVAAVVAFVLGARAVAVYLLVVRAIAGFTGWALKDLVRRHRPLLTHPVAHATGFSFPSGHALGSAAFYASVAVVARQRLPRVVSVTLAVAVPVVVATTRVLLGVHFPTDVAAGLAVGWLVAGGVSAILDRG